MLRNKEMTGRGHRGLRPAFSGSSQVRWAVVPGIVGDMQRNGNIPGSAAGIEPGKCRVYELMTVDWILCLEQDAVACPHSSSEGSVFLCRHPDQKRTLPLLPLTRPPPSP